MSSNLFKIGALLLVAAIGGGGYYFSKQLPSTGKAAAAPIETANKKTMVAYFSYSGNTKAVAQFIADRTGAPMVEIANAVPYDKGYDATVDQAKAEQKANARPAIKPLSQNPADYDIVFLGYPNWWGSYPMAVATFVENNKLEGKTVIPFFTHGGGGVQNCQRDLEKLLPSVHGNYLCLSGRSAKSSQSEVDKWLTNLGF